MEIKTEYAVCEDCGCEIEEPDEAVVLKTGEILCRECMMEYIKDNFADALENVKKVVTGHGLSKRYFSGEERPVYPRGRDIA